jgi:hypothetical protein
MNFKNIIKSLPKNVLVIIGFFFLVAILLFPQLAFQYIGNLSLSIVEKTTDGYWEQAAAQECNNFTSELDKIYCVNDFMNRYFKYDTSQPNLKRINQSFYGDCEGATFFYVTSLRLMNISAGPNTLTFDNFNHAFAIAYYNDSDFNSRGYCILEQGSIECAAMGD